MSIARYLRRRRLLAEARRLDAEATKVRSELEKMRRAARRICLFSIGRPGGDAAAQLALAGAGCIPSASVGLREPTIGELMGRRVRALEARAAALRKEAEA